ncbi:hypothetical protein [Pseudomonas mediterranea]|uniref:SMP-30/gluconolactonase/LRE family protein n=1 Tax=Pseudomonas mediterranea TaxID=183795 RepID=A0AAX2DFE9_9PSED|nr:hypothetical protein [Pseudomonas mediterranea]KGU82960.1 hypothetical protein N005_23405 [Pseudomonas mediterranea CFBP 5447]MBL0845945.1 hypothetical protein [Pseudomonas mediterranea]UZE03228.1 hypothetical protein LOY71_11600 [Pseudomonas mediterranea]CAH0201420.1 hypothetical protein SRABI112_01893 [Pseudomonas mediterranea]SDU64019.1 hypothetical protein SAMN05216476_3891 [Pseudomonas mediterranea]
MSIHIPAQPSESLRPSTIIAENLLNPRGVCVRADGSLLLVEAGSGLPEQTFSGRISRLRPDPQRPGVYLPRETLADGFRAMNMQVRMLRDEIMGLSDVACGEGRYLVSQTDYVEGSKLLDLQFTPPEPVFRSRGNLNALCYHPSRRSWLAVKPDTNQLVEFVDGQDERVLVQLPELDQGQEAVPVTLAYEPATDAVLISLFSGERQGDPARKGIDFVDKAGQVIRVHPGSGQIERLIDGLQLPTGLALCPAGNVLVLELCDRLQQPLLPDWNGEPLHGGFTRFTGRLLSCNLQTHQVSVLAQGLDTPSNLCVMGDAVLVSEGMGLAGRPLPTPDNHVVSLNGRLRRVQL